MVQSLCHRHTACAHRFLVNCWGQFFYVHEMDTGKFFMGEYLVWILSSVSTSTMRMLNFFGMKLIGTNMWRSLYSYNPYDNQDNWGQDLLKDFCLSVCLHVQEALSEKVDRFLKNYPLTTKDTDIMQSVHWNTFSVRFGLRFPLVKLHDQQ